MMKKLYPWISEDEFKEVIGKIENVSNHKSAELTREDMLIILDTLIDAANGIKPRFSQPQILHVECKIHELWKIYER